MRNALYASTQRSAHITYCQTISNTYPVLDRQERGQGTLSSVQEITGILELTVVSIATLTDIIEYLQMSGQYRSELERMQVYRREYGVD